MLPKDYSSNYFNSYNSLCDALNINNPLSLRRNTENSALLRQCKDELEKILQSLPDEESWTYKEDNGTFKPLMWKIRNVMQANDLTVENNDIGDWLQRQGDVISKHNLRLLADALPEATR